MSDKVIDISEAREHLSPKLMVEDKAKLVQQALKAARESAQRPKPVPSNGKGPKGKGGKRK